LKAALFGRYHLDERPKNMGKTSRAQRSTALGALGVIAAAFGFGCEPDIPTEEPAKFVEMEFDPSATPAKSYEPTALVMNFETTLIDFSTAGIDVPGVPKDPAEPVDPSACEGVAGMPVAQCEFYQYLERLDGFPTLTPGKTPVSGALSLSSIKLPDTLFIYDLVHDQTVTDVDLTFDNDLNYLVFDPRDGWEVGSQYAVALRGYKKGLTGANGAQAVASIIYVLLRQERSLTCGARRAQEIDPTCEFFSLFASDARFSKLTSKKKVAVIGETLLQLEQIRQLYRGKTDALPVDLWDLVAKKGNIPEEDVAILWGFSTHTASVVELNPAQGKEPVVTSATEIRLKVKGTIDPDTLTAFSLRNAGGTVFLLNVDKLDVDPTSPQSLPLFMPSVADGEIVLTVDPQNPLIEGDTYAVLLTTNATGKPLVPSPVTVLLRSRGELVDPEGISQVDGVSNADAQQLEQGRLQFKELLDDPLIIAATTSEKRIKGLTRELVAYLYGFPLSIP
jgi:hypothetical protein